MKTTIAKKENLQREKREIDASGKALGRLAEEIAVALMGKDKVMYTPHVDTGDFVEVSNADQIALTQKKKEDKKYYKHSGYPGGLKTKTLKQLWEEDHEEVLRKAVRGMLPVNRLRKPRLSRLSFK